MLDKSNPYSIEEIDKSAAVEFLKDYYPITEINQKLMSGAVMETEGLYFSSRDRNLKKYVKESSSNLPVKAEENKPTKEPKISTLNFDESIEVFQVYKSAEKHSQWKQAEIAHHVSTKSKVWGESSLKTFAESVGIGYEYARLLSKTFEAFQNPSDRIDELSFSHHRTVALHSPNPVEDIRESGEWSVRQLESHIKDKYAKLLPSGENNGNPPTPPEKRTVAVTMKPETQTKVETLKEFYHEPNPDKLFEKLVDEIVPEDNSVKICVIVSPEAKEAYLCVQNYLHGADEQQIFDYILNETARRIQDEEKDGVNVE